MIGPMVVAMAVAMAMAMARPMVMSMSMANRRRDLPSLGQPLAGLV